jgi:glycosyltransferase involved in cell wall biosynthesis|tara:strand:- start:173 stop:1024 length:852 start_codon:yes stop_codon:yes gene_type:complete
MFSIVIPTLNNFEYLKICLDSLKKNSSLDNEIIVHVNEGLDGSLDYIRNNNFLYTYSEQKLGLCSSTNQAAKLSTRNYILYSHDDMYFLPGWDKILKKELENLKDNLFYLSGTMIDSSNGHINFNCGDTYENFNEEKLLNNYKNCNFYDHQGTHWAPHLIHKDLWNKIGGFSIEFDPGFGSDPDLNMKLWREGVRLFKGINDFKVYHFGSISLRKKNDLIPNKGSRTFLKKWGITPAFFKKYYLRTGKKFKDSLKEPKKDSKYLFDLLLCKVKRIFLIFQKNN